MVPAFKAGISDRVFSGMSGGLRTDGILSERKGFCSRVHAGADHDCCGDGAQPLSEHLHRTALVCCG